MKKIVDDKKSKRTTKQSKVVAEKATENAPSVEDAPVPSTSRRTRKSIDKQLEKESVVEPTEIVDKCDSPIQKPKRGGRAKKVTEEKTASIEAVVELPKKRTLRAYSTVSNPEPTVEKPSTDEPKTKSKRTRKLEVEPEVEEKQPAPKQTRNKRNVKEVEVVTNDGDTPPIAKRTRRHK